MFVVLKGIEGPYAGKSKKVPLKAPDYRCLFGRTVSASNCYRVFGIRIDDFRLDEDPEISGLHATFLWSVQEDSLQIRDEGSFNGTALDYKRLKKGKLYPVKNGSVLFAGKSEFIVTIQDSEGTSVKDAEKTGPKQECYCPICFKDLSHMSETGRTQHVNACIPEKSKKQTNTGDRVILKASEMCEHRNYE